MDKIGNLFGLLTLLGTTMTLLNFFYKRIRKNYLQQIKNNKTFQKIDQLLVQNVLRKHKLWGYFTIVMLLVHVVIQIKIKGINLAGLIAAILLLIQGLLGYYGSHQPKNKQWLVVHRWIGLSLILAILIHLLTKTIVL